MSLRAPRGAAVVVCLVAMAAACEPVGPDSSLGATRPSTPKRERAEAPGSDDELAEAEADATPTDAGPAAPLPGSEGGTRPERTDAGAPATCADVDLVACFRFDGDVVDGSASPLVVTATGVSFVRGRTGTAVDLGPGAALAVAPAPKLEADALSVEAWIRRAEGDADAVVFDVEGRASMRVERGGQLSCRSPGDEVDGGEIPAGRWVHVACVFDGRRARVYVGGARRDEGSADLGGSKGGRAAIGAAVGGGLPLVGAIDDLRVYRVARTDEQIAAAAAP